MSNKCPWCNSENNHLYLKLKDYFLTQEEFELLECDNCKLLFTTPSPPPDKIGDYYKSDNYLSHNENNKGLFAYIYNKVKKINIRNKFKIIGDVKSAMGNIPKLLDIGCGVGDFLLFAKEKGWEHKCKGCHNPHTWNRNNGKPFTKDPWRAATSIPHRA